MGIMVLTGAHAEPSKRAGRGPASYVPLHPYQQGWKENPNYLKIPDKKTQSSGPLQFELQVRRSSILLPGDSPSAMPPSAQIIPLRTSN